MLWYYEFPEIIHTFPTEGQGYSEGVGESERGIFLKRRGVHKEFSFQRV